MARSIIWTKHIPNRYGAPQFDISADGKKIVYVAAAPSPSGDTYKVNLHLAGAGGAGAKVLTALPDSSVPDVNIKPRFSADGSKIALLAEGELRLVDAATGEAQPIDAVKASGGLPFDFAWSPDGTAIALLMSMPPEPEPTGGTLTPETWLFGSPGPGSRVAVLELATKSVKFVTDEQFDVTSMSWSPDSRRLAAAAASVISNDRSYDQDIYMVDRGGGAPRPIALVEGYDTDPAWSRDGRWIAFATQRGEGSKDWLQSLGLVNVRSGRISYPAAAEFDAGLGTPRQLVWTTDGKLLFTAMHHLQSPIFELNARSGRLRRFSADDKSFIGGLVISPRTNSVLFGRESFSEPRDLFASSLRTYSPQRLTRLNPDFDRPAADLDVVTWKSADGKWEVQGVLITPPAPKRPRPLITLIEGGPSMVQLKFGLNDQYPVHAFVNAGYAVFAPNTRGRSGYSKAFRRAIPDSADYVGGGFGDLMSGVDTLIARGIADPNRLGIAGFSYGAFLTTHAITRTNRFRAASINDVAVDLPYFASLFAANPVMRTQWDDQMGFSDLYDPEARARMIEQSPIYHLRNVTTPALLEFGRKEYGGMDELGGVQLFQGLRRFNVPAEFIRYPRTGHGIWEPRLRLESAQRNLNWFGRWIGDAQAAEATEQ